MTEHPTAGRLTRRAVLAGGLGLGAAAVVSSRAFSPQKATVSQLDDAALAANIPPDVALAATDGWVSIADAASFTGDELKALAPFWPDPLAVSHGDAATQALPAGSGMNLYVFGFRNVTGLSDSQVTAERGHAQISAPLLAFEQDRGYRVKLSNLGLSQRPDLVDGHTIHWHGFVNEAPVFDGVPELSLSVPIGRSFTYYYVPRDPGTYMYHCHYEDVEHVQMGMTGLLFVSPKQNKGDVANGIPAGKYAYNDYVKPGDPRSTAYDREYAVFLTEIFAEGHYRDAHIQTTDWTDFKASFWAINGRTFPDTLADPMPFNADRGFDPLPYDPNNPATTTGAGGRLQYQPMNAVIKANAGERILLRTASLGYQNHAMTCDNITFTVIGRDASLLRRPLASVTSTNAADYAYSYVTTDQIEVGPGESEDAIFVAPAFSGGSGSSGKGYDAYLLYDRNYAYASNGGSANRPGGMVTEIRVYPANTLPAQTAPNA